MITCKTIDDEFQFILDYPLCREIRVKYIEKYY